MANIVFLTLDAGGNVPPALAIGRELAARGHRVRVMGAATQQAAISAAGFEFRAYETPIPWLPAEPASFLAEARGIFRLIGDRGYAADLATELRRDPADVVVIDALIPGSIRAALPLGVPVVALMHTFGQFFLGSPVSAVASRLHGFSATKAWGSADLVLVASDAELDPASRGRTLANVRWTGPAELPPTSAAVPAVPPRVLVSLSTVDAPGQRAVLQRILDAVAPLPIEAIVTTGPAIDPTSLRAAPNTALHRELPHLDILPTCSAVIGHGGHSTTMRALMHGVPLAIIPCDTRIDQPMVAKAVAAAGAGIALRKKATPEQIRTAVRSVLDEPAYRAAAGAVGARLRSANGPAVAADAVLRAAQRQSPDRTASTGRTPGSAS